MNTLKKYGAEFVGTFALTLIVGLSVGGMFPVSTPVLAALTLGLFVYSVGHISGTHINPAVTIGAWSIGKIRSREAVRYIVAQVLGAGLAWIKLGFLMTSEVSLAVSSTMTVGFAEFVGTFFFTFGIASVVYGRTPGQFSGVVVGGSLLLGVAFAALIGSNGILNPAVAFGIGSFNFMYLFGPIFGSIVGMNVYKYLSDEK